MPIDDIPLPVCRIDEKTRCIVGINSAFRALLGWGEDIIGREFLALVVPHQFSFALGVFQQGLTQPVIAAFALLCQNGSQAMFQHSLFVQEGEIVDILSPILKSEKSFRESYILEMLPHPVFCVDASGRCFCANRSSRERFGDKDGKVSFSPQQWGYIVPHMEKRQPFSLWIGEAPFEGVFTFTPLVDEMWIVEYRWGREDVFFTLKRSVDLWDIPIVVYEGLGESLRVPLMNERFKSFGMTMEYELTNLFSDAKSGKILTLRKPNEGFVYYRPLVFPLAVGEITVVALVDETEYHKREILYSRLKSKLNEVIEVTERLSARFGGPAETLAEKFHLSEREQKLVQCIRKGLSNEEIARTLFVSLDTVKKNISNLYRKLGIKSRIELLQLMYDPLGRKTPPKG